MNLSVMYSYGPPHMAKQKQDDQLEHTYSSYVRIRGVTLKTCQKRWMIGKSSERRSGISVLAAWHDDDDDLFITKLVITFVSVYVYIYIYIYITQWKWHSKCSNLEKKAIFGSIYHWMPIFWGLRSCRIFLNRFWFMHIPFDQNLVSCTVDQPKMFDLPVG